VLILHGLGYI